jgi:hypothetical protein
MPTALSQTGLPLGGECHGVSYTMQDEDIPGLVRRFHVRSGILTGPATLQGMAGFQFLPGIGLSA